MRALHPNTTRRERLLHHLGTELGHFLPFRPPINIELGTPVWERASRQKIEPNATNNIATRVVSRIDPTLASVASLFQLLYLAPDSLFGRSNALGFGLCSVSKHWQGDSELRQIRIPPGFPDDVHELIEKRANTRVDV